MRLKSLHASAHHKNCPQTVRLAGLYDLERGPHSYWLKVGVVILDFIGRELFTLHLADAKFMDIR